MASFESEAAKRIDVLEKTTRKLQARNVPDFYMGWTNIPILPVYASATSVTFAGIDLTAHFTIGVKCAWYQSAGWRYGYVLSSSFGSGNTTLNFVANTSYSVANTAISIFKISYGTPPDFPTNFFYAVVPTGFSAITSVQNSHFAINGRICTLAVNSIDGTSNATTFTFNLPVASSLTIETAVFFNPIDNNTIYQHPMGYIKLTTGSVTAECFLSFFRTVWTNANRKAMYTPTWNYFI